MEHAGRLTVLADSDGLPADQLPYPKYQIITLILLQAELCRFIKGCREWWGLTDIGPWVMRWLCPSFLFAWCKERHCAHWQAGAHCGQDKCFKMSHSVDLCLCCDWCALVCFQDQENCQKLFTYKTHTDSRKSSVHWFIPFRLRRDIPIIRSDALPSTCPMISRSNAWSGWISNVI